MVPLKGFEKFKDWSIAPGKRWPHPPEEEKMKEEAPRWKVARWHDRGAGIKSASQPTARPECTPSVLHVLPAYRVPGMQSVNCQNILLNTIWLCWVIFLWKLERKYFPLRFLRWLHSHVLSQNSIITKCSSVFRIGALFYLASLSLVHTFMNLPVILANTDGCFQS